MSFKDKVFVTVLNSTSESVTQGHVVIVDTTADDGVTVATTTTATARPHCMAVATIAAGAVGKCQVWGYTDLLVVDVGGDAPVAGGPIRIGATTAGTVRYVALTDTQVATMSSVGVFLDAETASGAKEAFLDML